MHCALVFTFICKDRTGIIDNLSNIVKAHKGNWLESNMTKLADQFAGVVQVDIDVKNAEPLKNALLALNSDELSLLAEVHQHTEHSQKTNPIQLSIIGLDRPGIVKEVTQSLAQHQLNVVKFKSLTESAPMAGSLLFKAWLTIEVSDTTLFENFQNEIESIANQLDIDYIIDN